MNYLKLGYVMIVFVDSRYLHFFENIKSKLLTIIPIDSDFLNENIYAWKTLSLAETIMKSKEYHELVQSRIASGNPENIYPEYNCINHAKIDFINYALPFIRSPFVCWSDFGYHSSILKNDISKYPLNVLDISKFDTNLVNIYSIWKPSAEYNTYYILKSATDMITGSFYGIPVNKVKEFQKLYHTCLQELYSLNISDDDQHVLLRCYYKNPDLFKLNLTICKWPESLTDYQITPDRNKVMESVLKYLGTNLRIVEIGTDYGDFSDFMLSTGLIKKLYCIDPYTYYPEYQDSINNKTGEYVYNKAKERLSKYSNKVEMIRDFSHNSTKKVTEPVDLVYIDGNHSYEYVLQDLRDWFPKVRVGGVIIGDDAVDTSSLPRDSQNNVFIDWGLKSGISNCYGKYGVIKAFEDFNLIHHSNLNMKLVETQYIIYKS
jgi:hypothetical protein